MALSLQTPDSEDDGWLAEINTTPLVDVMLVLLIIFLLTVPVVSASVNVRLPVQSAASQNTSGDYVIISIDRAGALYLNNNYMPSMQDLSAQIAPIAKQAQLHIRADGNAPYSSVAPVVDMAQGLGLASVSLLTEPAATTNTATKR